MTDEQNITMLHSSSDEDEIVDDIPSVETCRPQVASFDLGKCATACCVGYRDHGKLIVTGMWLHVLGDIPNAQRAVETMLDVATHIPVTVRVALIEEQWTINRPTCMLEAALSAMLCVDGGGMPVIHVPTSRMTTTFQLPSGHEARKTRAVSIVESMVHTGRIVFATEALYTMLRSLKRKHDIADALLILLWYTIHGGCEETTVHHSLISRCACETTVRRARTNGSVTTRLLSVCNEPWKLSVRATNERYSRDTERRAEARDARTYVALNALMYKKRRVKNKGGGSSGTPPLQKRRKISTCMH